MSESTQKSDIGWYQLFYHWYNYQKSAVYSVRAITFRISTIRQPPPPLKAACHLVASRPLFLITRTCKFRHLGGVKIWSDSYRVYYNSNGTASPSPNDQHKRVSELIVLRHACADRLDKHIWQIYIIHVRKGTRTVLKRRGMNELPALCIGLPR